MRIVTAALLSTLMWANTAFAEPKNLTVDPSGSFVYALVYKAGMASAVAHDHVVHATKIEGTAVYDADDITKSNIDVTVDVLGIITDTDDLRKSVGLKTFLSDGQREEVLSHIHAKYQLWAEKYNTITFKSTAITGTKDKVQVTGDFTLRGVTKSIVVPMAITDNGDGTALAVGQFQLKQSDFGYNPFSALFGALKVKDDVDVVLKIKLKE